MTKPHLHTDSESDKQDSKPIFDELMTGNKFGWPDDGYDEEYPPSVMDDAFWLKDYIESDLYRRRNAK